MRSENVQEMKNGGRKRLSLVTFSGVFTETHLQEIIIFFSGFVFLYYTRINTPDYECIFFLNF